jgi:hypothetical protein
MLVARLSRRRSGKAAERKSPRAYLRYVEDDCRFTNAAGADASEAAAEHFSRTLLDRFKVEPILRDSGVAHCGACSLTRK